MKKIALSTILIVMLAIVSLGCQDNVSAGNNENKQAPATDNGVQVINSQFTSRRYVPITVKKGVPVKWTIQMDARDLNGCNNAIVIPNLGIEKKLQPGNNVIEFTPTQSGNIPYSCWMGMIRSNIAVVD